MATGLKTGYKLVIMENGDAKVVSPEEIKTLHKEVALGNVRITDINATENALYIYIER